jgi:hypothetical protein
MNAPRLASSAAGPSASRSKNALRLSATSVSLPGPFASPGLVFVPAMSPVQHRLWFPYYPRLTPLHLQLLEVSRGPKLSLGSMLTLQN